MSDDAKSPLAEFVAQFYFTSAWCVGSCGQSGFRIRETEIVEEALRTGS
jgi:hypothetical protein